MGVIGRIVVDNIRPSTPTGSYPAKVVVGETVAVSADIFRDGHDVLAARLCWRPLGAKSWTEEPMTLDDFGLDRWSGTFEPTTLGRHELVVEAWTDAYATWRHHVTAKLEADQDVDIDLEAGARLIEGRMRRAERHLRPHIDAVVKTLRDTSAAPADRLAPALRAGTAAVMAGPARSAVVTRSNPVPVWVDRERAMTGAWYELFPRSEGGLAGTLERLPAVAEMGFDVVYLPPVHPIGRAHRKGPGNTLDGGDDDPGSPWAIGGPEGGHTALHPDLGTFDDFARLVERASELGMEVALDYALQCSPDHPWVSEHPEWFHHRPDGSIAYAENPPKKYEDIYPLNFWPDQDLDRKALWQACKDIFDFWIARGVKIFRVDNPHTKPMAFWEWILPAVQADNPDVIFLAEAFTRPRVMAKLAEIGFSQSYTYFTWRTTKADLTQYVTELALGPTADFMRPNFWPNTPDIMSGPLRWGGPAAFKLRLVLAATLVPSYGIYSGYELCENEPASPDSEEYLRSEKYELKWRDWADPASLAPFVTLVNQARRRHPALQSLRNIAFHTTGNDQMMAWSRSTPDGGDVVLVVANLDLAGPQEATLTLDLARLGMPVDGPYEAYDELTGQAFQWSGAHPYIRLDPAVEPAHVLHLRSMA